jgi:hypothetical protein
MNPMCLRRSFVSSVSPSPVMMVPSIQTSPAVGLSSPASSCISVDLPEPESPMTAVSFSPRDVEIEAAERVNGPVPCAVLAAGPAVPRCAGACR